MIYDQYEEDSFADSSFASKYMYVSSSVMAGDWGLVSHQVKRKRRRRRRRLQ